MTSPIESVSTSKPKTILPVKTDSKSTSEVASEESTISEPENTPRSPVSYNRSGKLIQAARASKISGRWVNIQA